MRPDVDAPRPERSQTRADQTGSKREQRFRFGLAPPSPKAGRNASSLPQIDRRFPLGLVTLPVAALVAIAIAVVVTLSNLSSPNRLTSIPCFLRFVPPRPNHPS